MKRNAFLQTLTIAILLFSCVAYAKDDGEESGKRKKLSKPAKELLVGTWVAKLELDDKKLDKMLKDAPADQKEAAKKQITEMLVKLRVQIELKADGKSATTSTGIGSEPQVEYGTWKVISQKGMVVKLATKETGKEKTNAVEGKKNNEKKPETLILTFKNDNEFGFESTEKGFKTAPFKIPVRFVRKKSVKR